MRKNYCKSSLQSLYLIIGVMFFSSCGDDDVPSDPTMPQACFSTENEEVFAGVVASFNSDCSENAQYYAWDFGDGNTSTEANPTHTFDEEGIYSVTLTLVDSLERTNQSSKDITVLENPFTEHSGYIDSDEVWEEGYHLVKGTVKLRNGSLTIKPGAEVFINEGRHIIVGDRETTVTGGVTLTAEGTSDKPIIFKPASGSSEPGSWGNILFTGGASNNSSFKYCEIYYGGEADSFSYPDFEFYTRHGLIDIQGQAVSIENTLIEGAANFGILASNVFNNAFTSFSNNTIRNSVNYSMYLDIKYLFNIGDNNSADQAIYIRGQYMPSKVNFKNMEAPYYISFGLGSTDAGTELVIEAGTEIQFAEGTGIGVSKGSFTAIGTASNPIRFTSAQESKSPGDWSRLNLGAEATLEHCIIEYGGSRSSSNGEFPMVELTSDNPVIFRNNTIQFSNNAGLKIITDQGEWNATVLDNEIKETLGYGLMMDPAIVGYVPNSNTLSNTMGKAIDYGSIKQNVTWPADSYTLTGSVRIVHTAETSLTIESGSEILMNDNVKFWIGGESYLYGHIVADNVTFKKAEEEPWARFEIEESVDQGKNSITNCVLDGGGASNFDYMTGLIYLRSLGSTDVPTITGNTLKNSVTHGISFYFTEMDLTQNTFENNAMGDIYEHGP
ncbi:PKD domain-containing protein [Marivirga salinae]|uniref:PKD domain-containing protein n=1 Tax=Marivirga salinarum TaxID=3059078 RepID=A0AA51NCI0_9BACT|nr:PKD domain-containing protein [Marivirga sp. BDSF4-3]WMN12687.1 PKD domain-containing protein [Marivirga sp. BDSF4-3]